MYHPIHPILNALVRKIPTLHQLLYLLTMLLFDFRFTYHPMHQILHAVVRKFPSLHKLLLSLHCTNYFTCLLCYYVSSTLRTTLCTQSSTLLSERSLHCTNYFYPYTAVTTLLAYGEASIRRLLKIIGLFCKRAL